MELEWEGGRIHRRGTPGHTDFMSEIERSTWALDGAVLVVSAAEGVRPQTELLFHTFERQRIPVVLFLNKMDREGADALRTLEEIHELLSPNALFPDDPQSLLDIVSGLDDAVMEQWLEEGDVPVEKLQER